MPSPQPIHAFILDHNNAHHVVVYCNSSFTNCDRIKNLFAAMPKTDVAIIALDQISEGLLVEKELVSMTGQKAAPFIFVKGRHVSAKRNLQRPRTSDLPHRGKENHVPKYESPGTVRKEFYSLVSHNSASPWFM